MTQKTYEEDVVFTIGPAKLGGTGAGGTIAPFPQPLLCVQMDFAWTFETTPKCCKINHVSSHFYEILVVLKHHRRL